MGLRVTCLQPLIIFSNQRGGEQTMEEILDVCFEGLSVHPVTMDLVEHLLLDMPLEPAEAIDFGVDTNEHYRALQWMVQDACRGWEYVEDEEGYGLILHA